MLMSSELSQPELGNYKFMTAGFIRQGGSKQRHYQVASWEMEDPV